MKKIDLVVNLSKINLVLSLRMMHQQTMLGYVLFYKSIACKNDLIVEVLKERSLSVFELEIGELIQSDK